MNLRAQPSGVPVLPLLVAYFRSGWAFLIPYLAAYLLYAWLRWPVNAAGSTEQGAGSWVPSLLHVYWLFHALHLVLGGIALRAWWHSSRKEHGARSGEQGSESSVLRSPFSVLQTAAPWILLGLLFWIPGIYLEWPSDPWEHLRRINEWHAHDTVTTHSAWAKSSYFLPYSLTSHLPGLTQLTWLNFYYTGMCLLLCWQYYRLARAVGLGERASFIFVLLNALTLGNNIFSFYRYYGLSSSIFAQLGAVAFTHIALEALHGKLETGDRRPNTGGSSTPLPRSPPLSIWFSRLPSPVFGLLQLAGAGFFLLPLIAFNHIQGLGIAGFGIIAVIVWRLIEWRRFVLGGLVLAAIVLSVAAILWFPQHPLLAESYKPEGWLSDWSSFKLWDTSSPAFDRAYQIFGLIGLLNLMAGLLLLRRNSIVGWLTVTPPLLLMLPCVAVPLATALTTNTLLAFHRVLFAVPAGLGVVSMLEGIFKRRPLLPGAVMLLAVCLAVLIPSTSGLNRLWHAISQTPSDQSLDPILRQINELDTKSFRNGLAHCSSNNITRDVLLSMYPINERNPFRAINRPLSATVGNIFEEISYLQAISGELRPEAGKAPLAGLRARQVEFPLRASPLRQIAAPEIPWISLNDHAPVLSVDPITRQRVIENPRGRPCYPFTGPLIPISEFKSYRISISMRAAANAVSSNYLAIAWYRSDGSFISLSDSPSGSAWPQGWANGTFSYFGVVGEMPSLGWHEYSVTFGFGVRTKIPREASNIRVGALLNEGRTPNAITQISSLLFEELPRPQRLVVLPSNPLAYYTPKSLAGAISRHWSANHVSIGLMGNRELEDALANILGYDVPVKQINIPSPPH